MEHEIKFDKYIKAETGYHWDRLSKDLEKRNLFLVTRYNMVVKHVKPDVTGSILDVGCGDGCLSYLLAQKADSVIGLDVSPEALSYANKKTEESDIQNLEFIMGTAYQLPFRNDNFSHVVAAEVIEHLLYPEKMLAEIRRVFNDKGRILITTPIRQSERPVDPNHVREFSRFEFKKVLAPVFGKVEILDSHPDFLVRLNRKSMYKFFLNLINIITGFNPFETSGWRKYVQQIAIVET